MYDRKNRIRPSPCLFMKRKMMSELIRWKEGPDKNGLVITGSRRIGKTYIIDEFARANYAQYLRIDFRSKPYLKDIFKGDIDAGTIYFQLKLDFPDFNPGDGDSILPGRDTAMS